MPLTNPYRFYLNAFIYVPTIMRLLILPLPFILAARVHGGNMIWLGKLLWKMPKGKLMVIGIGWGFILPPVLAGVMKSI